MLATYQDFIQRVEQLGFLPMSTILPGYPSLGAETPAHLWHTGLDSDPWQWKDRAALEKQLAYGCILAGHKGFVCAKMYPVFYAAYHPAEPIPERWAGGTIDQVTWRLWQQFEEKGTINTSQARKLLHLSGKKAGSQVDAALVKLQQEYSITISGNMRKVSADGSFYGWPSNQYTRVLDWLPQAWAAELDAWHRDEARAAILDAVVAVNKSLDRKKIARVLGI